MLLFHCGNSSYAITGDVVIEVVPSVKLLPLATAPLQVVGLLNYGGIPIPVLDFCILMEERPCRDALHTRIMLLQGAVEEKSFQDKGVTNEKWPFLDGVAAGTQGLIQRVDADKLFAWYTKVVQVGIETALVIPKE